MIAPDDSIGPYQVIARIGRGGIHHVSWLTEVDCPVHELEVPWLMSMTCLDNRAAVMDLIVAAERSAATWTTPRAPGKWSPSQVVEHVAGGLEEGANILSGAPSIPMPPAFLRPLARLIFNRVLKKGVFPKGFKANKALDPTSGPATPAEARVRLEGALARFDQECRRRAASGQPVVSIFGTLPVEDLVRFTAIHTRHHCKQMPGAT